MELRAAGREKVLELIGRLGYRLGHKMLPITPAECDAETAAIISRVQPFTLTSSERIMVLRDAVRYLTRAGVPGSIVECGSHLPAPATSCPSR